MEQVSQNGAMILGGSVLGLIAFLGAFVAGIFILIRAFQTSVGWGLAVLLIPVLGFVAFIFAKWDRAAKPFMAFIASVAALAGSGFMLVTGKGTENFQEMFQENVKQEVQTVPEPDPAPAVIPAPSTPTVP